MQDYAIDKVTGDYIIKNGDFVVEDGDQCDQYLILMSSPGNWKFFPYIGPGLLADIGGNIEPGNINTIKSKISLHLEMDGFKVYEIDLQNEVIDAKRG